MSILEVMMILCFGFAWPINLYNSIRSKTTKGKNLFFLSMIVLAYVFGILHKLFYSKDAAVYFYLVNMLMVIGDVILYISNRKNEIKRHEIKNYIKVMR